MNYSEERVNMRRRRRKSKLNKLDRYLVFCFISLVLFTITMIVTFFIKDNVPDSLIIAFFGAIFSETTGCAIIKSLNIKQEEQQ